jgi:hypothetical protein
VWLSDWNGDVLLLDVWVCVFVYLFVCLCVCVFV